MPAVIFLFFPGGVGVVSQGAVRLGRWLSALPASIWGVYVALSSSLSLFGVGTPPFDVVGPGISGGDRWWFRPSVGLGVWCP